MTNHLSDTYFSKGWRGSEPLAFPVTETTVPPGGEHSDLVSPRPGHPHGLDSPLYPGGAGFDEALAEVIETRLMVLRGRWPSGFLTRHHPRSTFDPERIPGPLAMVIGNELDPVAAAGSVVGDHPLGLILAIHNWLRGKGAVLKRHPATGHEMFLEDRFFVTENLSDRQKKLATKAVEAKYWFGLIRPESAAKLDGGLFTASVKGCPCHPSYPALHATAASAASGFRAEYELKKEWAWEIFDTVYHHSMYRTFGAFHYAQDNVAGMKLGGMWEKYWIE